MTAPLNLDALEAAARATRDDLTQLTWRDRDGWYDANDVAIDRGCGAAEEMPEHDRAFIAAANPAAVLALIERLRDAETDADHYRKLAGELREQQMADPAGTSKDHLLAIIGAFYQICAEHDFPEHLLDILSDPEATTPEQVDALLPYVLPEDEPAVQIVEPTIRTKDEWTAIALAQGHGPDWVTRMLNAQDMAKMAFDMNAFCDPMAAPSRFLGITTTDETTHLLASPANAARLDESMAQLRAMTAPPHADDVEWIVNDMGELGVRVRGRCYFCYNGNSLVYDGYHDNCEPILHRNVGKREFGETVWPPAWVARGYRQHRYDVELIYTPGLSDGPPDQSKYQWLPLPVETPND